MGFPLASMVALQLVRAVFSGKVPVSIKISSASCNKSMGYPLRLHKATFFLKFFVILTSYAIRFPNR